MQRTVELLCLVLAALLLLGVPSAISRIGVYHPRSEGKPGSPELRIETHNSAPAVPKEEE